MKSKWMKEKRQHTQSQKDKQWRAKREQAQREQEKAEQMPNRFVGTMEIDRRGARVIDINSKWFKRPVFIPSHALHGARNGERVIVELTGRNHINRWTGRILDCLGEAGENDTEMHAILEEFGLPYSYPAELETAASKFSDTITPHDLAERKDFRHITTFTIDPVDAKDFDDALSIETLADGYRIGVHIADVTHYVKEGSPIDIEAYKRATSVYLVDRTIPMLPEHLCNRVCSLRPNEDKRCFSVIFDMTTEAEVRHYEICHTIIQSNRRFNYEEAQERIETHVGDFADEINTLHALAQKMREKRLKNGAMAFSRTEMRFELAPDGSPIKTYTEEDSESHQLIEEFMLLANRTVATEMRKVPFVYRVHDLPNEEKMKELSGFVRQFGLNFKPSERAATTMRQINKLIEKAKGTPEERIVETLVMRCMAKAVYSTENIGHYGLAFRYYTHFTSPIRRYPDMMVHRLLKKELCKNAQQLSLEERCQHCSAQERLAAEAERASVKYKQVEYMEARADKVYEGFVISVTEWGLYVQLTENGCEGLVSMHDMPGREYFDYIAQEFALVGFRTGRRFTIGDKLLVRVKRCNLQKRQLDFIIVS